MSILELTAVELGKKIKDKEITVVEATKAALEQIKAVESDVHGYVSYDEESAFCLLYTSPSPRESMTGLTQDH